MITSTSNLHLKYPKALAAAFAKPSYFTGKSCEDYDFIGVQTIRVSSIQTQPMNDYSRSGSTRYGTPSDLKDTYQEMKLSQDKSFTITIDKGDNIEQDFMKNAGKVLAMQLREQTVPTADRYAITQWVKYAGTVKGMSKPDKTGINAAILDALQAMDDALVPDDGRTVWLSAEMHKLVRESSEFLALNELGQKVLSRGEIGEIAGATVVKVPTSYLPADCYFLITYKDAILFPKQLSEAKVHQDPPGISGALLEGRAIYDAFVVGQKNTGVYAGVLSSTVQATPTPAKGTGNTFSISPVGDSTLYTTDGTDPRYSSTALPYTSGNVTVSGAAGASVTVNAVSFSNTKFTSAVGTLRFTLA